MNKYILVDRSNGSVKDYAVIVLDVMDEDTSFSWCLSTTDDRRSATRFNSVQQAVGMLKLVTDKPKDWSVDVYKEEL